MLEYFGTVYQEKDPADFGDQLEYLESTCHFSSFSNPDVKSLDEINSKIRTYLGSQTKRFEGLVLLKHVVEQCSIDAIILNAVSWAQLVLKVLQNHEENNGSRKLAYKVLISILLNVQIRKEISVSVIPGLLETVLSVSVDDEWAESAVSCLSICLQNFPGPCGLKKDKIKDFLIFMLDNWNRRAIEPLATCFCHFPSCCVDSLNKVGLNTIWTDQLELLICSLHSILNSVVLGTDISEVKISRCLTFTSVPNDPVLSALRKAQHFKAVGQCLAKMLVTKIISKVAIPLEALLSFISRTFSMTSTDFVRSPFISVIPVVHLAGLTILESLVLSCDQYLCSNKVENLLMQVLKANENPSAGLQSQFCVVRCATYRVFQTSLQKLKFGKSVSLVDYFSGMMIKDMKPNRSEVQLADTFLVGRYKKTNSCFYIIKTCIEALKALKAFVTFAHNSHEIHKNIYSAVKFTILQIQQHPMDIPFPYRNDLCQLELYQLLRAASIKVYRHHQSLVNSSLALFSCALEGSSTMVSEVCQEEFNTLNIMVRTFREDLKPVIQTERANSVNVKKNRIFFKIPELVNDEDSVITKYALTAAEDVDKVNGHISSPSQDSVLSSEEDLVEHSTINEIPSTSEELLDNDYCIKNAKQNGINSDPGRESRKRHLSSITNEIPPPKKVTVNVIEEEENDLMTMVQDFAPSSPDIEHSL